MPPAASPTPTAVAPPATRRSQARLRSRFMRLLVVAVALPSVLVGGLLLADDYLKQRADLQTDLRASTRLAAISLEQFLAAHVAGVGFAADTTPAGALPDLAALRARYPAFVTALATDAEGVIVASHPSTRTTPVGRRVDDRDYFRQPANTGQAYVSDAFRGRGFGTDALIGVSAPLVVDGRFRGIVEGSILIERFAGLRSAVRRGSSQETLIVDRQGRVIHASAGLPYTFLQPLAGAAFLRGDELPDGVGPIELHEGVLRDGGAAWAAGAQLRSGWRVVLFAPQRPVVDQMERRALILVGVVLFGVIGAVLVAGWQVRRLARAIGAVLDAMRAMATEGAAAQGRLDAVPGELQPVAQAIGTLVARLNATGDELREALARQSALSASLQKTVEAREREVAERTASLRAANVELERLSRTDPLTAALNVRGFRAWMEQHVQADGALRVPVGFIAIDIDHFKSYNDRYGHPAGDRALRRVSGAAQASLRDAGDQLVRLGARSSLPCCPTQTCRRCARWRSGSATRWPTSPSRTRARARGGSPSAPDWSPPRPGTCSTLRSSSPTRRSTGPSTPGATASPSKRRPRAHPAVARVRST